MLIGAGVVAIIAIIAGYVISVKDEEARKGQESKIVELQGQLQKLQDENNGLKSAIAKIQSEEDRLAADNQVLAKALAQAQVTGKVPKLKLPYPPK
jgi:septal ring factor EnvC (AmiA/AmiB activator)